ncbi:MAG: M48 family metallopeptidase [Saprospiraceae bacterium]|nr:M48 family metallopeptidase [Saprospiraceae bacterium]
MKQIEEVFQLEIRGQQIPARIIRERRHSVRASVGKDSVILRMPILMPLETQQKHIAWFKNWLEKKALKYPDILFRFETKVYQDGDILKVGKRQYILKINHFDKNSSSGKLKNNEITLQLSSQADTDTIPSLLSRLIAKDFSSEIMQRVQELNEQHFQQKFHKIALKHNQSNWGSCSNKGNINLSTRLLFAPDEVRDYVIIHELAHLIEHNHSTRFWKLVATAMPDYRIQEKWLRENAHLCRF